MQIGHPFNFSATTSRETECERHKQSHDECSRDVTDHAACAARTWRSTAHRGTSTATVAVTPVRGWYRQWYIAHIAYSLAVPAALDSTQHTAKSRTSLNLPPRRCRKMARRPNRTRALIGKVHRGSPSNEDQEIDHQFRQKDRTHVRGDPRHPVR